jgi:hypothetical protein
MVDQSLADYIKDGLKKGYKKPELEKILKENGWSNVEITEAFGALEKNPTEGAKPTGEAPDKTLLTFINGALAKGIPESKIRQALASKNWPKEKIDIAFQNANKPAGEKKAFSETKKQEKPKSEFKPKISFNYKKVLIYIGVFILISAVLALSLGVFFYIQAMVGYTITDPNTGDELRGYCLQEDCSDMKEHIYQNIGDNQVLIISLALAISLVLVLLHAFIPGKEKLVWIANIIFFLFICYMLFMWLVANNV